MTVEMKRIPGTALSEKDIESGVVLSVQDQLDARYAWDTGVGIGAYLAGLKRGEILGSYCPTDDLTVVPPRVVCEWCYRPMDSYVRLQDTGRVNTFSLCYVTWDVQRIEEPEIPAVIEIDGASPLHGILHKLGEVRPEDVRVGMRVQAVWKPPHEREGAITDILYFKPIAETER
ncbi:MAG: Zn-ribbon domain-containing OB-fold protein [Chloroflexota bacterium]